MVANLSASLNMAVSVGVLQGFKIGLNELEVSHLHYVDNTVLVGVSCEENLLTTKVVLRSFVLFPSLNVKFSKSCLFDVNLGRIFLDWDFSGCES